VLLGNSLENAACKEAQNATSEREASLKMVVVLTSLYNKYASMAVSDERNAVLMG
jgi:hypothetical protein